MMIQNIWRRCCSRGVAWRGVGFLAARDFEMRRSKARKDTNIYIMERERERETAAAASERASERTRTGGCCASVAQANDDRGRMWVAVQYLQKRGRAGAREEEGEWLDDSKLSLPPARPSWWVCCARAESKDNPQARPFPFTLGSSSCSLPPLQSSRSSGGRRVLLSVLSGTSTVAVPSAVAHTNERTHARYKTTLLTHSLTHLGVVEKRERL